MERFEVLNRNQNIHHHYLLEASAGTGKTFSIENIIVRLLLEDNPDLQEPLLLDQILVVTFTREATRDLTVRIRANLDKTLGLLERAEKGDVSFLCDPSTPDFLIAQIEKGNALSAKRRLEKALFCFDQAQIFTIHSFCSKMLRNNLFEGDIGIGAINEVEPISDGQILRIIRDFFRTGLHPREYSLEQLKGVLKFYKGSVEKLEKALLKNLKKNLDIAPLPGFTEQLETFRQAMEGLNRLQMKSENIIADFVKQAPAYKSLCNRSGVVKAEPLEKVERFARLFDQKEWTADDFDRLLADGLYFVEMLSLDNLQARKKPPAANALNYPSLNETLSKTLAPVIEETRDGVRNFARMIHECRKMLRNYLEESEKLGYDDLLKAMQRALQNPQFVDRVRMQYRAAIVDEFQDTDPIQWEIFRHLFVNQDALKTSLYLVGDPKQSIYAFRQADIYTYLDAAQALGKENHASLNTNYRSQPSLVNALNALFCPESSPGMISLPRINSELIYHNVSSCEAIHEKAFEDNLGSVHFCLAKAKNHSKKFSEEYLEKHFLLPCFAEEIHRLHTCDEIRFNQCAVLVSDRYQAKRVADFLQSQKIPALVQRCESLAESPALPALREIVQAVLHPRNDSSLKIALGGRMIGWTHTAVRTFASSLHQERILAKFYALRRDLKKSGFAFFFHQLMQSSWHEKSQTIIERLLSQHGGLEFYQDLQQISQILVEEEYQTQSHPEFLLAYLDEIELLDENEDERIKKLQDPCQDAVSILTMHSSKGLEFPIVFALGLITRPKAPDLLLPVFHNKQKAPYLQAVKDIRDAAYVSHCQEIDAEKMRQLYVAMTRAKYRVYVPVAVPSEPHVVEPGCASPMELFLSRFGQPPANTVELYNRIESYTGKSLCDFIDRHQPEAKLSYKWLDSSQNDVFAQENSMQSATVLIPPPVVHVPGDQQFISSFTTMARSTMRTIVEAPHDFMSMQMSPHHLPSGSDTGNLFHKILEKVPIEAAKTVSHPDDLHSFIHPYLLGTPFVRWKSVISQIVLNALKIPLQSSHDVFRLCDINPRHCYREAEFLYQCTDKDFPGTDFPAPDFLKGVIDLFFIHNDKYYLLDWKTNWLGKSQSDYKQENLQAAMEAEDYFLQANVYCQALRRYLRLVDKRPFDEIFGGIFYIFLRGLDPCSTDPSRGIFYITSSTQSTRLLKQP